MNEGDKTTTYSFDDRGRRSGYGRQEESVIYGYSDDDRLVSFIKDAGKDGSIDVTATYVYDSEGQRIRSVVTSDGVTTTTNWTYENLILLRSVAVTNDEMTTVEYVNDDAGRPVGAWVTVPGRPSADFIWFVTNSRGDVLSLLAENSAPLSYRAYSAYGETISGASQAVDSITATQTTAIDSAVQLRFAGYAFDSESGLYYCSQRYYDPVTCQWLTQDPARADGEESAHQYCGGNPIGAIDSTGLAYKELKAGTWGQLNEAEKTLAKTWRSIQLPSYFNASQAASARVEIRFPKVNAHNNKADAFRHAYWNVLLSRFIGRSSAKVWTDAHEAGATGQPEREKKMDLHNNFVGRDISRDSRYLRLTGGRDTVESRILSDRRLWWFGHGI